jgi:hypothetical protein
MGLIRTGPPEDLILKLARQEPLAAFVETGTCQGGTAAWAAQHFPRVHTIEFSRELFEQTRQRHAGLANVEFIFGDSRKELPRLVAQAAGLTLFWLDAHWSGSVTYGDGDECPLMEELEILARAGREALIFIDDARCFLAPPAHPHRASFWPAIDEVCAALHRLPVGYVVVFEDVIIAVPARFKELIQRHCQDKATEAWRNRKGETAATHFKRGMARLLRRPMPR